MNNIRENIKKAKKKKDDEYYTPKWYVDEMLDKVDLTGKKVICNCDGAHSEIYKAIKERGYDVDYAEGDYESVDYEQYDIIITNPPFSTFKKFYKDMKATGKDFIVIGSNLKVGIVEVSADISKQKLFVSKSESGVRSAIDA